MFNICNKQVKLNIYLSNVDILFVYYLRYSLDGRTKGATDWSSNFLDTCINKIIDGFTYDLIKNINKHCYINAMFDFEKLHNCVVACMQRQILLLYSKGNISTLVAILQLHP